MTARRTPKQHVTDEQYAAAADTAAQNAAKDGRPIDALILLMVADTAKNG
ncbi:hypothetical protein [Nonomuraea salmonea]|uniref:Uncharacterized protein n=1 Tax=Nonomuraea salmonea TaxID=46181 RepID=A0ABV5P2W9_9ACTN